MALLGYGITLFSYDSGADPATNQEVTFLVGSPSNDASSAAMSLASTLMQSGGVTSPVAELSFEASADGEVWTPVGAALETDGSTLVDTEVASVNLPRYVRIVLIVGGSTKPAVEATVQLWSTVPLTAVEV